MIGISVASVWRLEMTMLRLKARQRELFVEKMPDVANIAAASMLFGQFLSDKPFSLSLGIAGLVAWRFAGQPRS